MNASGSSTYPPPSYTDVSQLLSVDSSSEKRQPSPVPPQHHASAPPPQDHHQHNIGFVPQQYSAPPPQQQQVQQLPGVFVMEPPRTVVVQNVPQQPLQFGPKSMRVTCYNCHANVSTSISSKANSNTHRNALCMFFLCCWLCFCIPYCCDSCKTINHTCPNCNAFLGAYVS